MSDLYSFWKKAVSSFSEQVNVKYKVECLDIACGNGVASKQVSRFMPQQAIDFTGIDRANVEFVLDNQKHDVKIFSGEKFNSFFKLPRKFDLVVSNFGIEYLSLEETERLLTEHLHSKATLIFNIHDESSIVSKSSIEEIQAVNAFLNDERLKCLEKYLVSHFQTETAKQYLTRLSEINDENEQRIAGCGISDFVVREFVQCQKDKRTFCSFSNIRKTYNDYISRLGDQISSAKKAKELLTLLAEIDFQEHSSEAIKTSSGELISVFKVFINKRNFSHTQT
ncbi:class I SAM-dependent methyltransferase [Idiomarina aminovorans]|uniref:class I SAM-dependent methyltransferase n=1 Tax=Idiomarina aminovorans TaxID=2914829 RepID=UPI00200616E9|nr:class I SAM-dependent methyltransferase [Idiomarina sp. ATCH4]MCK7460551.1 class I SAM-dependent methyltransferase [Idiomarina sp. ATCH4]